MSTYIAQEEYVISSGVISPYFQTAAVLRDAPAEDSRYVSLRLEYEFEKVATALAEEVEYIRNAQEPLSPHEYENLKRLCDVCVQLHKAARKAR